MDKKDKKVWWDNLEEQWKRAYNEASLRKGDTTETPTDKELDLIITSPALRIVGPEGAHPNLSFKLTNLSGIKGLKDLQTLVITNHDISSTEGMGDLPHLKACFLFNNQLKNLKGLESCTSLEELYVNVNQLESLEAIAELSSLKLLNCAFNNLASIAIPPNLKKLYCIPNDELPDAEIIRIERNKGILCRRG